MAWRIKKELLSHVKDYPWNLWYKMIIGVIGLLFYAYFLFRYFFMSTEDKKTQDIDKDKKNKSTSSEYTFWGKEKKSYKYRNDSPPRLLLVIMNSLTIFYLMLAIQEWGVSEAVGTLGVDPSKIPDSCKTQQRLTYWTLMGICIILVLYNIYNRSNVFYSEPTTENWKSVAKHIMTLDSAKSHAPRYFRPEMFNGEVPKETDFYATLRKTLNVGDWAILWPKYPSKLERALCYIFGVGAVVVYICSVFFDYVDIGTDPYRACVHPRNSENLKRYIDPYSNSNETTSTTVAPNPED